jgi:hypothetical protein
MSWFAAKLILQGQLSVTLGTFSSPRIGRADLLAPFSLSFVVISIISNGVDYTFS